MTFQKTELGWSTEEEVLGITFKANFQRVAGGWVVARDNEPPIEGVFKTRKDAYGRFKHTFWKPHLDSLEREIKNTWETLPGCSDFIPEDVARTIYSVLVEECQADPSDADHFVLRIGYAFEWRFSGSLGFGGKFRHDYHWCVTCYPEDKTLYRQQKIIRANRRLTELEKACQT